MVKKKQNYKYFFRLYSLVDEYLASIPAKQENLPDVIVSFCIVVEKIFKIKLHKENPVLVYENTRIKEDNALCTVIKGKELNIETIRIRETIGRYRLMFEGEFTDDEMQVLIDIYNTRNHFVHGYKPDDDALSDKENIIKKMGTVWEKISNQAESLFGKDLIKVKKPKEKYSEEELEKVLIEEVKKKIENTEADHNSSLVAGTEIYFPSLNSEICPRCGNYGFSIDNQLVYNIFSTTEISPYSVSDLYKCKKCHLELTRKEYEITKKIKTEKESRFIAVK